MEIKESELAFFYQLAKRYGRVTLQKDDKLICVTWDYKDNCPIIKELKSKKRVNLSNDKP